MRNVLADNQGCAVCLYHRVIITNLKNSDTMIGVAFEYVHIELDVFLSRCVALYSICALFSS